MLRVAIDATPLLGDRTGIGVAVTGMVRELGRRSDLELVAYGLTLRGWTRLPDVVPPGMRASRRPAPAGPLLRIWARADHPPAEWWTGPADIVHGTNYVVPPARRARRMVTVWDMTPVRFPEMSAPTSLLYPRLVKRAVDRGAWVHTGSRFVADEIQEYFGVEPERVKVVPPGIDVPLPRKTAGPSGGYILGIGRIEPRKDFPSLVRAFDLIAGSHPDLELVIAGPPGWAEDDLERSIEAAAHRERIRRVGWVEDAARLIGGAAVFVYPSLYEGFGFPPLEAMALGVPVVATEAGSIPEVAGSAAELVPPGDVEGMAEAIQKVLTDDRRREQLIQAGSERAAGYTWEACSDGLALAYAELASA